MSKIATHEITACYFAGTGEVELTWEDLKTGKHAGLTAKVTRKEGNAIANTVCPCVFYEATAKGAVPSTERIARAIWAIRREAEDRCDMELEDMGTDHSVWKEAQAVRALFAGRSTAKEPA